MQASISEWLRFDERDPALARVVAKVISFTDKVHQCPVPAHFFYELKFYREVVAEFPLTGCEVEWDRTLVDIGAIGLYTPLSQRNNVDRSLISLYPDDSYPEITLIHEIGHLIHDIMLPACRRWHYDRYLICLGQCNTFKNLLKVRKEKEREFLRLKEHGDPGNPSTETGKLMVRAIYHSSEVEWFCRIYLWLILRDTDLEKVVVEQEFGELAVDGRTRIYPSEEELDILANQMKRIFTPQKRVRLPFSQKRDRS